MTELLIERRSVSPVRREPVGASTGLTVAGWDGHFATALLRLLSLLDDSTARALLATGRMRELFYVLIEGPAGAAVLNTLDGARNQLAPVLGFMRDHLDQSLAVESLAQRAGMSRAAFDRHFRSATGLSPLQYLKALRLNDAAMQIAGGVPISVAAAGVGYTSPSQFSREFKRHFGTTPRAWSNAGALDPQATAAG